MPGGADWTAIVASAVQQGVAPVLFARLKEQGVTPSPEAARQLREAYIASAALNMRLLHERDRILAAMGAAQVSVIPIKGASIAETVYADAALRPMGDIDLWVRRPSLEQARQVMEALGYAARSKASRPLALQDALAGETQMFKTGATPVELHWNIFPGEWLRHTARIDEREIWDRSSPRNGDAIPQLSPEDTVIHLCVHLSVNHQMSGIGLRTLVDLDGVRRKWTVDWSIVAARARAWRVSCATWLVLNALAELFGDPQQRLPLRDLAPSALRQSLLNRLASVRAVERGMTLSEEPTRFLFLLALVDKPADGVRLAWRGLFPDRQWLTLRYDSANASAWRTWQLRFRHIVNLATRRDA